MSGGNTDSLPTLTRAEEAAFAWIVELNRPNLYADRIGPAVAYLARHGIAPPVQSAAAVPEVRVCALKDHDDYKAGIALIPYTAAHDKSLWLSICHAAGSTNVPIRLDRDVKLWHQLNAMLAATPAPAPADAGEQAEPDAKPLTLKEIADAGLGLEYVRSALRWAACGYVHTPERIAALHTSYRIVNKLLNAAPAALTPTSYEANGQWYAWPAVVWFAGGENRTSSLGVRVDGASEVTVFVRAPSTQVAKEPLTAAQYNQIPELCAIRPSLYESVVRGIERAHGIGTKEQAK